MKSMTITVISLLSATILVFICTIAQIKMDIYTIQKNFLCSFFIWWHGVPVFPGGLSIAIVLLINLGVGFAKQGFLKKKEIFFIHFGFVLLLVGEGLRILSAEESFIVLKQGESVFYTESGQDLEIAVIDHSAEEYDLVKSVTLGNNRLPSNPIKEPLSITIKPEYYSVEGFGTWPLIEGTRNFGNYEVCIRSKRKYYPYGITLNKFHHETHPGSNIPKSFSSDISVSDEEGKEFRRVEVAMNSPFSYKGKTYYQENYANNGDTSVLHVVENRWKNLPYLSILIISLGLISNLIKVLSRGK